MKRACNANLTIAVTAVLLSPLASFAITNPTPQRSYVSTSGSDANNCGLAAPCRTIQAALAQTNPGGEVLVLDSGGYGNQNNGALIYITQPVTIVVPKGIYAGISPPAGFDGILVTVPATTGIVTIRGLTINGQGGNSGINIQNGAWVEVQDTTIENIATGISLANGSNLVLENSLIVNTSSNGINSVDSGMTIADSKIHDIGVNGISLTASPATATGSFARIISTSFRSINGDALFASDNANLAVHDCWFGGNANSIHVSVGTNGPTVAMIDRNFFHNTGGTHILIQSTTVGFPAHAQVLNNDMKGGSVSGIEGDGPATVLWLSGNRIYKALTGIVQSGGAIVNTHQDNFIDGGPTPVSGTLTPFTTVY
jgi:hypothetical protein